MKIIWRLFLCMTLLSAMGCSSKGFNRGELKKQIGIVAPVTDDADIAKTMNKKANLPKPFKLAVYFKNPIQNRSTNSTWRWSEADKESFFKTIKRLKNEKISTSTKRISLDEIW